MKPIQTDQTITLTLSGLSHNGNVHQHNEDAILMDQANGVLVVADGMGGYACGEVASEITIEAFKTALPFTDNKEAELKQTILNAHQAIVAESSKRDNAKGMGSTVVAAFCKNENFIVSWVGDSRAYLWQRGKGLKQVNRDHSYLELLLAQGQITPEQARTHPNRNVVTESLGHNEPQPDTISGHWQPGDRLVLCSDGLSDELDDTAIASIVSNQSRTLDRIALSLIEAVLAKRGKDNISVIIAEYRTIEPKRRIQHTASNFANLKQTVIPILIGVGAAIALASAFIWFKLN